MDEREVRINAVNVYTRKIECLIETLPEDMQLEAAVAIALAAFHAASKGCIVLAKGLAVELINMLNSESNDANNEDNE